MSAGDASNAHPPLQTRQATLILPATGERVKRHFTLRDDEYPVDAHVGEETPLLPTQHVPSRSPPWLRSAISALNRQTLIFYNFWTSQTGINVLKCSFAYLIATLTTFCTPLARALGTHQDGKQLVANITIWFDPAHTQGAMIQAMFLATCAWLFTMLVGFSSMAVSLLFRSRDMLAVGHAIVLLIFTGGSFGTVAWVKQRLGHPLVNSACSVISNGLVTVLTREGAIQMGYLSTYKIVQLFKMIFIGIIITFVVSLTIFPWPARRKLEESLMKSTDAFSHWFTAVASSFVKRSHEDVSGPIISLAHKHYTDASKSIDGLLTEAKFEHYALGTETEWRLEYELVRGLKKLEEDLGGLQSALNLQSSLLFSKEKSSYEAREAETDDDASIRKQTFGRLTQTEPPQRIEDLASGRSSISAGYDGNREDGQESVTHVFDTFIMHLGPPMRSFAYTLKEILNDLPYASARNDTFGKLPRYRSSLEAAVQLFQKSRAEAMSAIYRSKDQSAKLKLDAVADFEEVSASCCHFCSCLLDFAEHCLAYLDTLDKLELEVDERPNGRTWTWLLSWYKRAKSAKRPDSPESGHVISGMGYKVSGHEPNALTQNIHRIGRNSRKRLGMRSKPVHQQRFPYSLWPHLRFFRRDDIKYAIKIGGGGALYALFSYLPETRPIYQHWHFDWGLIVYMLVCSTTIGASNTNASYRIVGTFVGATAAIVAWILCRENAVALAFAGWVVSLPCFYLIKAKGKGAFGRFILLTYDVSVLYSYSLSQGDPEADSDESRPALAAEIIEVVKHRIIAINLGILLGLVVTRVIWPVKARVKVQNGLGLLWLRMGLIWKHGGPLCGLAADQQISTPKYMDIREEAELKSFLTTLRTLKSNAVSEFDLQGPFPSARYDTVLRRTAEMLDAFHALNSFMPRAGTLSAAQVEMLLATKQEHEELATRISHLFSTLASSIFMSYPLADTFPSIETVRDRFLARVFEYRRSAEKTTTPTDEDYELLYVYALVTSQIAKDIQAAGEELAKMYTTVSEQLVDLR